jgi:hypothetical protein
MDDIKYKLRKIKIHRLVDKMKEDITEYLSNNIIGTSIEQFCSEKYPEISVEVDRKFDETDKIWKINIIIQKPVEVKSITTLMKLTPTGIKYNN